MGLVTLHPGGETFRENFRRLEDKRRQPEPRAISAHASTTTSQNISHATTTALQFDAQDWETVDGMHDTSTNNDRLTIVTPGIYAAGGMFRMNGTSAGIIQCWARAKNSSGTLLDERGKNRQSSISPSFMTTAALWDLDEGDYLELLAYQSSGVTRSVTEREFWAHRIG